jgi:hypothetical protein
MAGPGTLKQKRAAILADFKARKTQKIKVNRLKELRLKAGR